MGLNIINEILLRYKTVAVVGLSRNPSKDSYRVSEYLQNQGYNIIPINPFCHRVLGERCYRNLLEIPEKIQKTIEIVSLFRPSIEVLEIVKQVIQLKQQHTSPYVIWMQLGIVNEEAAHLARRATLMVIMDKCMMQEHRYFFQATKNDDFLI